MTDDFLRKLIELAAQSGKSLLSEQTGFIQHHPKVLEGEAAEAIPLYENMLYVLALFRTKTHENMQEAKILLDRLLYFQQKNKEVASFGNFPIYLYDFPYCRDHFQAFKMMAPFYWIIEEFSQVLGEGLQKRTELALKLIFEFAVSQSEALSLPEWAQLRLLGVAQHFQIEYRVDLQKLGSLQDTEFYGNLIHSLQMLSRMQTSNPFWRFLESSYDRQSFAYIGPALRHKQAKFLPEVTLYDYYMAYFSESAPDNILKPQLAALSCSLIRQEDARFNKIVEPRRVDATKEIVYQDKHIGFSLTKETPQNVQPGFYPFYLASGRHTLAFDIPKGKVLSSQHNGKTIELLCELSQDAFQDRTIACSFFVDNTEGVDILVNKEKATTFLFGDTVSLKMNQALVDIHYELIEGEAHFMGHIMRGNRPSQIYTKGFERYSAYDLQIFLRGIRSNGPSKIKISCTIDA